MSLDVNQAPWNSAVEGRGCIVPHQKAYHVAKLLTRLTSAAPRCAWRWKKAGIPIKYHHPEVGASGQFEIEPRLGEMTKMADDTMMIKYIIHNVAMKYGKTATLMPKPVFGEAETACMCICCF